MRVGMTLMSKGFLLGRLLMRFLLLSRHKRRTRQAETNGPGAGTRGVRAAPSASLMGVCLGAVELASERHDPRLHALLCADDVHHGVDQREMGERLGEVPEVAAAPGVDL